MGRDKALVRMHGRPLAWYPVTALRRAGAVEVLGVCGRRRLGGLAVREHPDRWPGEGPLGGIVTAVQGASCDVVVVLGCDMPAVTPATIETLVAALRDTHPSVLAALAVAGGRLQPLVAAYRRSSRPVLEASFLTGERSPVRALAGLDVVEVTLADSDEVADVDTPGTLAAQPVPRWLDAPPRGAWPPRRA